MNSSDVVSHSPSDDAVTTLSSQAHISHATNCFGSPACLSEKLTGLVLADACNRISSSLLESHKRVEAKQPSLFCQMPELPLGMNLSVAEISRFFLKAQVFALIILPSITPIPS